jgi:hypothetical protein
MYWILGGLTSWCSWYAVGFSEGVMKVTFENPRAMRGSNTRSLTNDVGFLSIFRVQYVGLVECDRGFLIAYASHVAETMTLVRIVV